MLGASSSALNVFSVSGKRDPEEARAFNKVLYSEFHCDKPEQYLAHVYRLGSALLLVERMTQSRRIRFEQQVLKDNLDLVFIDVYEHSKAAEFSSCHDIVSVAPDALFFRSMMMPHELACEHAKCITLILPGAHLRGQPATNRQVYFEANDVYVRTLVGIALNIAAHLPLLCSERLNGLLSAFLAMCPGLLSDTTRTNAAPTSSRVLQARALVQTYAHDPNFGAMSLANMLGMSRASLYRLLEPLGGVSAFIRKTRLIKANRMLRSDCEEQDQIQGIAAACGFTRLDSFTRAFKDQFGITPSQARAVSWTPDLADPHSSHRPARLWSHWLNQLNGSGGPFERGDKSMS